jgi:hypothetical protein
MEEGGGYGLVRRTTCGPRSTGKDGWFTRPGKREKKILKTRKRSHQLIENKEKWPEN